MCRQRQFTTFHLIALIGLALSGFGCASQSDLAKLREELLGNIASTQSSMEQRIGRTTTQLDVRKQQETVAFQSQFTGLQQQVEGLRQSIGELSTRMDAKFQALDQVLTGALLIEQNELKNRLKALDKSLKDLEPMSRGAGRAR